MQELVSGNFNSQPSARSSALCFSSSISNCVPVSFAVFHKQRVSVRICLYFPGNKSCATATSAMKGRDLLSDTAVHTTVSDPISCHRGRQTLTSSSDRRV